jgi:hypothetical protein
MSRPKSAERPISIRMPEALTADIVASAERASGKSLGDWIKDAAEFKLKLSWMIQAEVQLAKRRIS